jgi:pilus assembly protein CpaE
MAANTAFGRGELTALLVCPDPQMARAFRESKIMTSAFSVLAAIDSYPPAKTLDIRLRQIEPQFVLVDVASDLTAATELMRLLQGRKPGVLSVALHQRQDSEAVVAALRAGACEFLSMPFDEATGAEALARLHRLRPARTDGPARPGSIVIFSAAKPGAGSSTLATHVAHALRREHSGRVLLLDLDLEAGTTAFYLKLAPAGSARDLLLSDETPSAGDWARALNDSQGLDVLAAPETPYSGPVTSDQLSRLLAQASARYEWIIVDAPNVFQPASLMAISESGSACLVTTPDLASLHLTRRAIALLTQLGMTPDRYRIVVNRMSRREGISQQDIERMFRSEVFGVVPNEYFSIHRAISLGQPLSGEGDLGKAISALARRIAAPAASAAAPKNGQPVAAGEAVARK